MIPTRLPRRYSRDPRLSGAQAKAFGGAMDQAFRKGLRSDLPSLALHALLLAAGYGLVARAILADELGPGFVVLPWVVEYLAILWLGLLLAHGVVRDPVFRALSKNPWVPLGWTLFLLAPYAALLAWNEGFDFSEVPDQLAAAWGRSLDTGIAAACGLVVAGLLLDTVRDLRVWQRRGGVFVWPATQNFGLRFAALIVVCFAAPFVIWLFAVLAGVLGLFGEDFQSFTEASGLIAWALFAALLSADLLVLVGGALLHRFVLRERHEAGS